MRRLAGERALGAAAVALVFVASAACSTDGDDPALDGAVPTTDADATSSSTSRPSTATTARACPSVERARDLEGLVDQVGDVDGDGRPDIVQSFPEDDHVTLLVDLAAGGGATTEIAASEDTAVELLGTEVLDAAHDGREVLWVRVGAGASTTVLGLHHLRGCSL